MGFFFYNFLIYIRHSHFLSSYQYLSDLEKNVTTAALGGLRICPRDEGKQPGFESGLLRRPQQWRSAWAVPALECRHG